MHYTKSISVALQDYLLRRGVRESSTQRALRQYNQQLSQGKMQIAPEQGQFFNFLIRAIGARRIIEVGTFTGYSALAMASALPSGGQLIACEINETWAEQAQRRFEQAGLAHKIDLRLGPAQDTLATLIKTQGPVFDFIFIDADKGAYDTYYELALQLLPRGGIVALDNMLRDGRVACPHVQDPSTCVIRDLNEKIQSDPRVDMCFLPIADGVTCVRKRF